MDVTLRGAGGGGGGGSFTQRPDNLRSVDTFEGLLGLCAGPIKGPVNGMKSVRLNKTPVEGSDGTENYKGVTVNFADGDPLKFPQIATLKLGSAGAPIPVGVDIPNPNPSSPGDWVSRTVPNLNAEAIDLRFIVQQLYKQTKKGIFENTLDLEIQMKPSGMTTWINPFDPNGNSYPGYDPGGYTTGGKGGTTTMFLTEAGWTAADPANAGPYLTVKGKTTSPYVKEVRIKVPNTGDYADRGWDIRVRLIEQDTVDADPNFEKRLVSWESMTAVYTKQLGDDEDWRGVSWLQIYGQASDNFNGLPAVDGVYDCKIVNVPPSSVYDPTARTFTGATWDGSWVKSFTQDPAWIINDAISDPLFGIATFVPGAHLNKWDALELSKWASEQVPDGSGVEGATHPRFSLNVIVDQPQKSDDLIRFLAGACGAAAFDSGDGEWRLVIDKPQTPVAIFTHENIEGEFIYSHTDVDTRYNDITVTFLNEEFDYREDQIRIQDDADIALRGRKPTKVVAVGCTNRQQALRWAVLRMRTGLNEFRINTFTTNRQGKYFERFNWLLVADGSLNELADTVVRRTTGRMISSKPGGELAITKTETSFWANQTAYGDKPITSVEFSFDDPNMLGHYQEAGLAAVADAASPGTTYNDGAIVAGLYFDDVGDDVLVLPSVTRTGVTGTTADVWKIDFDGTTVRYYKNGVEFWSDPLTTSSDLVFKHRGFSNGSVCRVKTDVGAVTVSGGTAAYSTGYPSITVRDAMRLEVGVNYTLTFTYPNPDYDPEPAADPTGTNWQNPTLTLTRTIMNDASQRGDVTELFLDMALPVNVAENVVVALSAIGLPAIPKVYRILDINYDDDGEKVTLTTSEVDTGKWAASEAATDDNIQDVLHDFIPPPTAPAGGMWVEDSFASEFGVKRVLTAYWDHPDDAPTFDKYRIEIRHNDGPWQDMGYTRLEFYEMQEPEPGDYDIRVYSVSLRGLESLPLEDSYELSETPSNLAVSYGLSSIDALYDYTGATPQNLPLTQGYKLSANGVVLTDGVTWQYRVLSGGVNGFTSTDGWQTMSVTGGAGQFQLTSADVSISNVEIKGTTSSGAASLSVKINKVLASPPSGGGGGGSSVSQSSGFGGIGTPWTSFVSITSLSSLTVPSGSTATQATINVYPFWDTEGDPSRGPWDIELKLQRNVSGTWTDIGTVQHSSPDPKLEDINGGEPGVPPSYVSDAGTISAVINDTGLTAGTYNYRLVARVASGSTTGNGGGIAFTGSVNIAVT